MPPFMPVVLFSTKAYSYKGPMCILHCLVTIFLLEWNEFTYAETFYSRVYICNNIVLDLLHMCIDFLFKFFFEIYYQFSKLDFHKSLWLQIPAEGP